jgi:hypothetical protein
MNRDLIHDYGEGKIYEQEAEDSMIALGYALVAALVVLGLGALVAVMAYALS